MLITPARRAAVFLAIAITGIAVPEACAQADKAEHNCEKAAMIVGRGKPDKKEDWAWSTILGCGPAGGLALRDAWEMTRTSADTAELETVFARLWGFRDAGLFTSARSIFLDAGAAPESRVFSGMLMLSSVSDDTYATWAGMTGGRGDGSNCSLASVANRPSHVGMSLPNDARSRLDSAARQIAADRAAPEVVRRAARCIVSEIVAEDRAKANPIRLPPDRVR